MTEDIMKEQETRPKYSNVTSKHDYAKYKLDPAMKATFTQTIKANRKDIDKLKKELGKSVQEIKHDLRQVIDAQSYRGTDLTDLADRFKIKDPNLYEQTAAIHNAILPKGVPASQAGISFDERENLKRKIFQAENELFLEKTGFPGTGVNVRKIAKGLGLYGGDVHKNDPKEWYPGMSDRKLREIVLLDDFNLRDALKWGAETVIGTFAPELLPAIPIVEGAIESVQSWINPKTHISKAPYKEDPNMLVMADTLQKQNPMINRDNNQMNAHSAAKLDRFAFDAVDIPSICTVMCPEFYKACARFDDALPASISTYFVEIPVIPTTANGNFYFWINPYIDLTSGTQHFITYTNALSTYNVTTGAWATGQFIQHPLAALTSTIQSSRLVGLTVTITPTVTTSTNLTNGQWDIWHDPSSLSTQTDWGNLSPYLTLTNIGYKPFYQRGPIVNNYTQVYYNDLSGNPFINLSTATASIIDGPIVAILSGANLTGNQVATVTVNMVFNNVPTNTGLATQPVLDPKLGPFTADLMNSMLTETPQVFMSSVDYRMNMLSLMQRTDGRYQSLMEVAACCPIKKKVNMYGSVPRAQE